jgi:hypothetical protein
MSGNILPNTVVANAPATPISICPEASNEAEKHKPTTVPDTI